MRAANDRRKVTDRANMGTWIMVATFAATSYILLVILCVNVNVTFWIIVLTHTESRWGSVTINGLGTSWAHSVRHWE